jgi:peptide deformylase
MLPIDEVVQHALDDESEPVAQSVNSIITALDELMAKAVNSETVGQIAAERIGIGQIRLRAELILSFLDARKPQGLRVIK